MIISTMLQYTESVRGHFKLGKRGGNNADVNTGTVYQYSTNEPS